MNERYRICQSDEDYARYAQFYIRHYRDFGKHFTLADVLMHILESARHARILLILDDAEQVIAWGQYRFQDDARPGASSSASSGALSDALAGATVVIEAVAIAPAHRGSRLFLRGFRRLLQCIEQDNPAVQHITFNALAHHVYLNRLYAKFAAVAGAQEYADEREHIFTADYDSVKRYLNPRRL